MLAAARRPSSTKVRLAVDERKKTSWELIARAIALSRRESPAIVTGLLCSVLSGGVIIGEVRVLPFCFRSQKARLIFYINCFPLFHQDRQSC